MLARSYSAICMGVDAVTITVEVDVSDGIAFFLVGLPDNSVKESQQRISVALSRYGYRIPGKKVVINMAPADIRKIGSSFDLSIALGIIAASGQRALESLSSFMIIGELALDGTLRSCRGSLPIAIHAKEAGFKACILPIDGSLEAMDLEGIAIYGVNTLIDVLDVIDGLPKAEELMVNNSNAKYAQLLKEQLNVNKNKVGSNFRYNDFAFIKGQSVAKRALEIAASGGHNVLMMGTPGSGKSLMAKALPSILPFLSSSESLETSKIYSIMGELPLGQGLLKIRPFRSPHHTASLVSIVGGGTPPMPGEVSMAHNGVLYLDEMPEFSRVALESLRQPLEDREIFISRLKYRIKYPASFMLIASMNPCPCGYYGDSRCTCSEASVIRYFSKISGPLLDRIDIYVKVASTSIRDMLVVEGEESSEDILKRVLKARDLQFNRYASSNKKDRTIHNNSQLTLDLLDKYCKLDNEGKSLISKMENSTNMSARAYSRIIKLSRTIADLEGSEIIKSYHLAEALRYRVPPFKKG